MPDLATPEPAELTVDQCRALLATQQVGRLGVMLDGYPLVIPVDLALDGSILVLRLRAGSTLTALQHANVTLEVDQIDPETQSGWSVLVRGLAEEVTERHGAELLESTHASGRVPWTSDDGIHEVRLIPHRITGRRLVGPTPPPALESAGYL